MGRVVEVVAAAFEQIRQRDRPALRECGPGQRGIERFMAADLLDHRVEELRRHKAHGQQNMLGQHEAGRRRDPGLGALGEDQRRRHVERAVLDLQPAGRLDLAELVARRHAQAEGLFDPRPLVVARIDQVDPGALRQRRCGVMEGEGAEHGASFRIGTASFAHRHSTARQQERRAASAGERSGGRFPLRLIKLRSSSMIRKSGSRFSEKIMLHSKANT